MDLSPTIFYPAEALAELPPLGATGGSCGVMPDWGTLIALTRARQAASPTARVQARLSTGRVPRGGAFARRVAEDLARWQA